MNEWNGDLSSDSYQLANHKNTVSGRWDVLLTIIAVLATSVAAFTLAYLTKDNPSRPFWLLGVIFAAPVAALMGAVLLKEKAFPSMTPSSSRKAQLALASASVAVAFIVGCFCRISNSNAGISQQEIVQEKSNVLFILDKSGSMYTDDRDLYATNAVVHMLENMSASSEVGMLIDVGWKENNSFSDVIPLEKRKLPIASLTDDHREALLMLARHPLAVNENFPRAFDTALDMIREYPGDTHSLSILMLSDGEDCTEEFRSANYEKSLKDAGVPVNYLYVCEPYSTEMDRLARSTGGQSIYVDNYADLEAQIRRVSVIAYTDIKTTSKDALRDIGESDMAKIVTGSLLLLEGFLIGLSLTIMLSLQKQKRFQMFLSPLCAAAAFTLLAFGHQLIETSWIREGIAFSLLGLVLMQGNMNVSKGKTMIVDHGAASDPFYSADSW